jgi:hypothetical protein
MYMRWESFMAIVNENKWRVPLFAGITSMPFVVNQDWQSSTYSVTPLLLVGVGVGYVSQRRALDRGLLGRRTGFVGSVPALWMLVDMLRTSVNVYTTLWFFVVQVGASVGGYLAAIGFSVLAAVLGTTVGHWLAAKSSPDWRSHTTG